MMINTLSELYERNPKSMNLSRILGIFKSIKVSLKDVMEETEDYDFAIQLGLLASKTDYLHLEIWIESNIIKKGDSFVKRFLMWIDRNLGQPVLEANGNTEMIEKIIESSQLDEDKLRIIFNKIRRLSYANPLMLEVETRRLEKSLIECLTKN